MLTFVETHSSFLLSIAIIAAVTALVICLVAKLFKLAIGVIVISIFIPILFTIFWGDGSAYVSRFASMFEPAYQQQIEGLYKYYKDKDTEDPFVNYDAVSKQVTDIFDSVLGSDEPSDGA